MLVFSVTLQLNLICEWIGVVVRFLVFAVNEVSSFYLLLLVFVSSPPFFHSHLVLCCTVCILYFTCKQGICHT